MKSFVAGDRVHVARIGTGVVREARNAGRYLVEIKGRSMVVTGAQLERAESVPSTRERPSVDRRSRTTESPADPRRVPTLDLHGKTVIESLELLDAFLNEGILDGHSEIAVVHGRSGGRVKAAVHKRLRETSAVRAFRLDPHNAGVTIVAL
jgi:dsDNA-specific endonuclease/ATPase MutS2